MRGIDHGWWPIPLVLGISASACGIAAAPRAVTRCEIVDAVKLPPESGRAATLCAALDRAVKAKRLAPGFSVKVLVGKRSSLTADVTLANGRTLPALHFAQMDRAIDAAALEQFAAAIADHVARAPR